MVEDSGAGFDRQAILDQQLHAGRLFGRGMTLIRHSYQMMIEMDSAPGRGTTVRVYLPLARGESSTACSDERI